MDDQYEPHESGSQYPDPEQSGLAMPWLDQYQPMPPQHVSSSLRSTADEAFMPLGDHSAPKSESSLNLQFPHHGLPLQSKFSENGGDDTQYEQIDRGTDFDENMSDAEGQDLPSGDEEAAAQIDSGGRSKRSRGARSRGESGSSRGRPRGRGRGGAKSRGRGGKGLRRGPRPALEPSKEFATLQKEAINVFIDQHDYDKALSLIQEAISLNPEVYAAHALMSEIYFARNDIERGVAALFSGAHAAPRDPLVWHQVADACLQKSSLDRDRALQQAAYCFARIVTLDPDDLDSRFQRAAINRELGLLTSALRGFEKILAVMPHNPSVLQQVAEICLELGEIDKAKELYRDCISYHRDQGLIGENAFSWSDVNVYVELFAREDEYEDGIAALKTLSRWLLGRAAETYWDEVVEDDREWDPADEPRRAGVLHFVPEKHSSTSYGFGLPLELRVKLGIFRLNLGSQHRSEALNHFEWLEPDDVQPGANIFEYADLFREVGEALNDAREFEEALRFFQPLKTTGAFSDTDFWLAVAASSYIGGHIDEARECYELAKASDDTCAEARTQLAKIYKDAGRRDEALRNAQEALGIGRRAMIRPQRRRYERREAREAREATERELRDTYNMYIPSVASMAARLKPIEVKHGQKRYRSTFGNAYSDRQWKYGYRMAKRQRREQMSAEESEAHRTSKIQSLHSKLQGVTPEMRKGDLIARNTWLECADELIHDYRSNRVFYPAERHVRFEGFDADAKRRAFRKQWVKGQDESYEEELGNTPDPGSLPPFEQRSVPTEYRGIPFDVWLDIFLEQALATAKLGEEFRSHSYETITAVLDCTIWYHQPEAMLKTYVCYFVCALALNDGETLCNVVARWFMREFQFVTDAYRLFAALNLLYSGSIDKGRKESKVRDLPFRQSANQKFLLRQIRAMDPGLERRDQDGPASPSQRYHESPSSEAVKAREAAGQGDCVVQNATAKEIDIVLLSLYAAIMYTGNSFPNALHYLYRAHALDPGNPMLLLHMALCYLHQNFKRQNENKHFYIVQGLALFQAYADARVAKAREFGQQAILRASTEIEFNRARIWNMLNLTNLAVSGYKRVLSAETESDCVASKASASLTRESAYALQTAYALSGNMKMAQQITETWLVI